MGKSTFSAIILTFLVISIAFLPSITGSDEEEEEFPKVNRIAVLDTDFGIIKFELYENWTPITSSNFIELAESGHYDGVLFHRIVDDFVIQTGDGGGSSTIPLEIHTNATHIDGAVGMARSEDPDSAEDQFYICDGAQHGLDGDYAVFGLVFEGMEVVREIAEVPVWGENNPRPGSLVPLLWRNVGQPKEDVFLNMVTIETPEVNETDVGMRTTTSLGGGFPYWALGIVFVVGAAVLFIFFKVKKSPKAV
ncbi:MAG: peptidylprolyl isomerase [Thermoplasmata archaeon]|nr:MAG: peptidylprolyl isomerase [Thermoplasmata archaeon]